MTLGREKQHHQGPLVTDWSEGQKAAQDTPHGITIPVRVGVQWTISGRCAENESPQFKAMAIESLRHHIYGDTIDILRSLEESLYGRDYEKCRGLVNTLIKEMRGIG